MSGMLNKSVKIVYYSGTGATARVADYFAKALKEKGCELSIQPLNIKAIDTKGKHDLLVIIFAVHACNAPKAVYDWIENTEKAGETPAAVISVSGGGEITPNTACRVSCIRKLEKKGYKVIYEEMLVMPSNWIVPTKDPLALKLLQILPTKAEKTVDDILSGTNKRTKPLLIDRLFSLIGEIEKHGTKVFGKRIKVTDACNDCSLCAKGCPAGNITMNASKPEFGDMCQLCLQCIYKCPNKALKPGIAKFVVIKEGYCLERLEKKLPYLEKVEIEELTKGYLWRGVRKYLLENDKSFTAN